jgi:hypothetical protein
MKRHCALRAVVGHDTTAGNPGGLLDQTGKTYSESIGGYMEVKMMEYKKWQNLLVSLGIFMSRGGWLGILLLVVGLWNDVHSQEIETITSPLTVGDVPPKKYSHPEVGQLNRSCTATLISDRHFLTAAHCIHYAPFVRGGTFELETKRGTTLSLPVDRIFSQQHRGFGDPDITAGLGDADIAVGRLVNPVSPSDAVPARISPRQPSHGDQLTAMGYGCTNRDTETGGGVKRFREYIYDGKTKHTCPVDSGGPVFLGGIADPGPIEIVRVHSGWRNFNGHDIGADAVRFRSHILALTRAMENGDICYRVHVQDHGWMPAICDGGMAGTTGQSRRMEAIQLWSPRAELSVCYQAHVQDRGWMEEVCDGVIAGTTGKELRLEALVIRLARNPLGERLRYQAHVEDRRWMEVVGEGVRIGTTGQSRRLEAIRIWLVP